jgi:MHS family proline/betaine transporter-like MFS transporter
VFDMTDSGDYVGSLSAAQKIRRLPYAIAQGALNAVFCSFTFGGSVFVLFLDHLGLPKTQIGFVLSLLPFCGLLAIPAGLVVGRFGVKRTFVVAFAIRKLVMLLLVLAPIAASRGGASAASAYVSVVIFVFAILRAIGETGYYPWFQEFVPNFIRGRFTAAQMILTTASGAAACWVAGYVIGHSQGSGGYQTLIAVGVAFGLGSVVSTLFIPGGAPIRESAGWAGYWNKVTASLRDRDFLLYLGGTGLCALGWAAFAFVPLFMREQVGLGSASVIRLEAASLLGAIGSSLFVGRASDRYGGRPVLLASIVAIAILPVAWMLMPRHSPWSSPLAYGAACWWGLAGAGISIGGLRLVFSEVIPAAKTMGYTAVYYACSGLIGGVGPLAAGRALAYSEGVKGHFLAIRLDQYTPVFVASFLLILTGAALYRLIGRDSPAGKQPGQD